MANIVDFETNYEESRIVSIERFAEEWKRKARVLKLVEDEEQMAREALIMATGGLEYEGYGVKVSQVERKGVVEYKAIPELAEVNLEDYRKPGTVYWTVKPSIKE